MVFIVLLLVTGEMRSRSRLDSELFREAPPPIAMPVPADFVIYKSLQKLILDGVSDFSPGGFCFNDGITLSRLRDALSSSRCSRDRRSRPNYWRRSFPAGITDPGYNDANRQLRLSLGPNEEDEEALRNRSDRGGWPG